MLKETGERQVKPYIKDVDLAHRERYTFASELICEGYKVADIGCGIGYGSYIMATTAPCDSIHAIDISEDAILYAKEHYSHPKIEYKVCNILEAPIKHKFDIITAFEVVEHIDNSVEFLSELGEMLDQNGIIILSTPNENVVPFLKDIFPFHVRHFSPDELLTLAEKANLELIFRGSQNGRGIYAFDGNAFNIYICKKEGSNAEVSLKNVIQDTPFHKAMAEYELIDWLLSNSPQLDFHDICRRITRRKVEDKGIYEYIIQRIDYHRRTYMPQVLNDNPNFEGNLGELEEGVCIEQSFIAGLNGLCGLSVLPGLFGTFFNGVLCLSLYDEKQTLIGFKSFTEIKDNQLLTFNFLPVNISKDKKFTLEIYIYKLEDGSKLTFYKTKKINNCVLKFSGELINSTLTFQTIYL